MKIAYEPHPVSPERKRELREQGFRIVDQRFKPKSIEEAKPHGGEISIHIDSDQPFSQAIVRKLIEEINSEMPPGGTESAPTRETIAKMPKAEVIEWLEAHGAEPSKKASVAALRKTLTETMFCDV